MAPILSDVLKCKVVVSEMPAQFVEYQKVAFPSDKSTLLLAFGAAKMSLRGRPSGSETVEVEMNIPLYDFLMETALGGPDVERERDGVLWQFTRM
jgi:hypothetical protein